MDDSELARVELAIERLDVHVQRDMLSVERRLGAIEDALAGWAGHYWSHIDHPPRRDDAA